MNDAADYREKVFSCLFRHIMSYQYKTGRIVGALQHAARQLH